MIGSLITRGLALMFGYAYPAYECYKTVEMNKPDVEQLRFWCQYWILVAIITVCERIGDNFVGWVPMYGEAKLAFFIYLWYPKTKGTSYVYDSFFKPYMSKHETEIDRNLLELRTRAGDMVALYWQRAASYGQTRIFEILQYIASQSTPPQPAQPQQEANRLQTVIAPSIHGSVSAKQPQPSSQSTKSTSEEEDDDATVEVESSDNSKFPITSNEQKATLTTPSEEQIMRVDKVTVITTDENGQVITQEDTIMKDDALRGTRTRSRKARTASSAQ